MPLPPYIRKGRDTPADREAHQTVYARVGAIAALTAGLHFTPELLQRLDNQGLEHAKVTLHVGLGTFVPIKWKISPSIRCTANGANCREYRHRPRTLPGSDGRVVAVGTTAVRVLESAAATGAIRSWSGETNLFIYPPYRFAATDVLITNFHLPHSTLLLLAGAFAGAALLEKAYRTAMAQEYRFFSYGDAMVIF